MKKILLTIGLILINCSAWGMSATCNGTDSIGRHVTLYLDSTAPVINLNGDRINLIGKTNDGAGVVTQNYITTAGVLVYDEIYSNSDNSILLYQRNAVTKQPLATAYFTCNISNMKSLKFN